MESRFDYFKNITDKLLSPATEKKDHYLYLLGTGAYYVPAPNESINGPGSYVRGETFSYLAQLTSHLLGETPNPRAKKALDSTSEYYGHPFESPSVDVLDGVDIAGNEVPKRIAKAKMLALAALAEGKTTLYIAGFSRGASESIVLTHEIERVRDLLIKDLDPANTKKRSLAEIISDSKSADFYKSSTKSELSLLVAKHKPDQTDQLLKEKLLSCLPKKYDLALMRSLPDQDKQKAEENKIYLDANGKYLVRDLEGIVQEGQLDTSIDLDNLENILKDVQLKAQLKSRVLTATSKAGHTKNLVLYPLDPVPGNDHDIYEKLKLPKMILWEEKEGYFNFLPDIVNICKGYLMENERSACFKPVNPQGMNPECLPGRHGSGDGGLGKHDEKPVACDKNDFSSIQDRVIVGWLDLLRPEKVTNHVEIKLLHKELDDLVNAWLPADKVNRRKQLLAIYERMIENMPGFKELENKNYPGTSPSPFSKTNAPRLIRNGENAGDAVNDINPHGDGKFVNQVHLQTYIDDAMYDSNNLEMDLAKRIAWLDNNFKLAFEPSLQQGDLNNIDLLDALIKEEDLARKKSGKDLHLVEDWLSPQVCKFTKTYLQNHLKDEELIACANCVTNTFTILGKAENSTNESTRNRAKHLKQKIQDNMAEELIKHQNEILLATYQQLNPCLEENINNQSKMKWLLKTQNLLIDLDSLNQQIYQIKKWCGHQLLIHGWEKFTPFASVANSTHINMDEEINLRKTELANSMKKYIYQQQNLLRAKASELLNSCKEALIKKPDELSDMFYNEIARNGKRECYVSQLEQVNNELVYISTTLQQDKNTLEAGYDTLGGVITRQKEAKDNLQLQLNEAHALIQKLQDEKEAAARAKQEEEERKRQEKIKIEEHENGKKEYARLVKEALERDNRERTISENKRDATLLEQNNLASIINKAKSLFAHFVDDYTRESIKNSTGFFGGFYGLFSVHREDGRKYAAEFNNQMYRDIACIKSINEIKIYMQNVIEANGKLLTGAYREASFKTYLLAYYACLDNFNDNPIANKKEDVRRFMTDYVKSLKNVDIESLYLDTFNAEARDKLTKNISSNEIDIRKSL